MSENNIQDARYILFVSLVLIVSMLAVADPFDTASPSFRTFGGLLLGPMAVSYGLRGLRRGTFPELS